MAHDVYYQFIQTPEQARRVGARGGKVTARNRRQRLDGASVGASEPEAGAAPQIHIETTAAAIALLDAQYPWLRGAEKRFSNRSQRPACDAVLASHLN
jgi:hypothetical protein